MSVLRSDTAEQASRILSALEEQRPGATELLRREPLEKLQGWDGVSVQLVAEVVSDADCSVAGGYRADLDPPTIVVARSASVRRQHFTALHELGHHIQRNNYDLLDALRRSADPDALEEAACDAFAARVLLPEDVIAPAIGVRGPTADDIVTLFHSSHASRAACCVRAAEKLGSPGAIFLVDSDGTVNFAIGHGMAPPAKGTDQSGTPLISRAMRAQGSAQCDTFIRYRDGSTSDRLYGDCAEIDGFLVAVAVLDRPPWRSFAPPRTDTGTRAMPRWWTCEYCQDSFETFTAQRCQRCQQPRCPAGHCACTTRSEQVCTSCWMSKHASQFPPGSRLCQECLEG